MGSFHGGGGDRQRKTQTSRASCGGGIRTEGKVGTLGVFIWGGVGRGEREK